MPTGGIDIGIGAALASAVGETAAAVITTAAIGAGVGAIGAVVTGGDPLKGALFGGLSGGIGGGLGALGAGTAVGDALGIGSTAGNGLVGAASGALMSGITGQNPLFGAITGGVGGLASGLFGPDASASTGSATGTDGVAGPTTGGGVSTSSDFPTGVNGASGPAAGVGADTLAGVAQASNPAGALSQISGATTPGLQAGAVAPDLSNVVAPPPTLPTSGVPTGASISGAGAGVGSGVANNPSLLQQVGQYLGFGSDGAAGAAPKTPGNSVPIPGAGTSGNNISGNQAKSTGIIPSIGSLVSNIASNPLALAMVGGQVFNATQQQPLPTLAQQQASTQGAGFNSTLPQYTFNSARNPIANYYTYGYSPQPVQISNTLTPVAHAAGGRISAGLPRVRAPSVRIRSAPSAMPHRSGGGAGLAQLGAMAKMRAAGNPAGAEGMARGALSGFAHGGMPHARGTIPAFEQDGHVNMGSGTKGQADKIPAYLSEDEFVLPADVTSALGDGSPKAGSGVLTQFVANVRAHKAVKGQPPKAKAPEQYLPKKRGR